MGVFESAFDEAVDALGIDLEDSDESQDNSDAETLADEEQPEEEIEDLADEASAEDDESEDDDLDDEDDVEEPEEDEEEEEEEEDEEPEVSEVADDAVVQLPDGTTATVKDLKAGYLRQQDYTRKTQEVARYRDELQKVHQQMTDWYEARAQNPGKWAAEIATSSDDPAAVLAEAIEASGPNADVALAGVIRSLVEGNKLSPQLVDQLGLQRLAEKAQSSASEARIARLERELEEERQRAADEAIQQQLIAQYEAQWAQIVQSEGLQFESPEQESNARFALLNFAREREITDLPTAWAALAYEISRKPSPAPTAPDKREKAKKAIAKKRQTRAVSRQKAGGGTPKPVSKGDLDSAAEAAMAELGF